MFIWKKISKAKASACVVGRLFQGQLQETMHIRRFAIVALCSTQQQQHGFAIDSRRSTRMSSRIFKCSADEGGVCAGNNQCLVPQFRSSHSLAGGESRDPLDLLKEIQKRIQNNKEYSPVLSSHRRGPSTNIATFESRATVAMAGEFGRLYRRLPPLRLPTTNTSGSGDFLSFLECPRKRALQYLAQECSVDYQAVDKAVQVYQRIVTSTKNENTSPPLATYNRLHDVSAPIHQEILRYLLLDHASEGMESILALREDLREWMRTLQRKDTETVHLLDHLKLLEEHFQDILSVWFVPGLLEHRRITYESTPASILEHIVRYEAVHPVSSLRDLRRRLGSDRRVFAIFHPTLKEQPLFVLHVALLTKIPSSMATIQADHQSAPKSPDALYPKVACFYSISNLRKGLIGVGMGEFLIHKTVERLQKEIPSLDTFCTLSPIPGFRSWLESDTKREWIPEADLQVLANSFNCSTSDAVAKLLTRLQSLDDEPNISAQPNVRSVVLRWAAHYLYYEKHRRQPLDRVARFHISNGAIMDQLHWGADLSPKGWRNSFGLMATYRYDLLQLSLNQKNFESNHLIPLGASFSRHVQVAHKSDHSSTSD